MFLETGSSLSFWPPEMCQNKLTPQPALRSRFNFPVTRLLDSSLPHRRGVSHSLGLADRPLSDLALDTTNKVGLESGGKIPGGHFVVHTVLRASQAVSGAQIPWL